MGTPITQCKNQLGEVIGLHVYGVSCPPKIVPFGKTREINASKVFQSCVERRSSKWLIGVRIRNKIIFMKGLTAEVLLNYPRIVFSLVKENGSDILKIDAIRHENIDWLLEVKYLGFMRNFYWDKRKPSIPIAQVDLAEVLSSSTDSSVQIQQLERKNQELERKEQIQGTSSCTESSVQIQQLARKNQELERKIQELERNEHIQRDSRVREKGTNSRIREEDSKIRDLHPSSTSL